MTKQKLYKIQFLSQGKTYELYARSIDSSPLWGFTVIRDLVFESGEGMVIDPAEERLREEFRDTQSIHLPMQAILRIEEVNRRGGVAIRDTATGEKIMPFPLPPRKI